MNNQSNTTRPVHLVGSIPLTDADEVFTEVAGAIGEHVHSIPDGETGVRSNWLLWQVAVFKRCEQLEVCGVQDEDGATEGYSESEAEFRLKPGVTAEQVDFGDLGYAAAAISSYQSFKKHKASGKINSNTRFQVSLPTPLAVSNVFFEIDVVGALEPVYEKAMLRELAAITEAVPAEELAIQWDVAVEFMMLETPQMPVPFDDRMAGICERLVRLVNSVPEGVEAGFHLCYGDTDHKHFVEPKDAGKLVEVANGISAGARRAIDWIHMPVPKDRSDEAYFEPLRKLSLRAGARLYLGLVHLTDGIEGTRARIQAAEKFAQGFGIATECGFGRRDPETILELLKVHRAVASGSR